MATGDELAAAIDRQRQVRDAAKAEGERIRAERERLERDSSTNPPAPPPLGGKVAP